MHEETELEERVGHARERKEAPLVIVDDACRIVYESQGSLEDRFEFCGEPGRLRPELCAVAKNLMEAATGKTDRATHLAFVAPAHVMRLRRLNGQTGVLFALLLEPFRSRDAVRVAVRRYALTRREHEILMLILEGASAAEIGAALHISEHTVQGYFKRLLKKTDSRNRVAMVANVLDWTPASAAQRRPSASRTQLAAAAQRS